MYICDMCKNPIEAGTQYVNVFDKNVCLDCAVRNTLDDVMATFGITYTEAPDEIVADCKVIDAMPEQVEITDEDDPNAIHEKNGWFYTGTGCRDDEEGERL